jgi:hypothetical protein
MPPQQMNTYQTGRSSATDRLPIVSYGVTSPEYMHRHHETIPRISRSSLRSESQLPP